MYDLKPPRNPDERKSFVTLAVLGLVELVWLVWVVRRR